MKVLFYSCRKQERSFLAGQCPPEINPSYTEISLSADTVSEASGYEAVSLFTSDDASAPIIAKLAGLGVHYLALRSAGFDQVDLDAAAEASLKVCYVPAYSTAAVAEHTLLLTLALLRRLPLALQQTHLQNFSLDHLVGRELGSLTVGIIGTGHIGSAFARILSGFGCSLLAFDSRPDSALEAQLGVQYTELDTVLRYADVLSLHVPLNPDTRYLIDARALAKMKTGAIIVNTARGAQLDTSSVLAALSSGRLAGFAADVYEYEKGRFFHDLTGTALNDELLSRLLGMPQVILTPHMAFATGRAMTEIARSTFDSLRCWQRGETPDHELTAGTEC